MKLVKVFALTLIMLTSNVAFADFIVFDFEDITDNSQLMSLSYTKSGVTLTISRSTSTSFVISNNSGATGFGARSLSPFNGTGGAEIADRFVIELSQPASSISIQLGDFGQDRDALNLQAFASPNLIGNSRTSTDALPGGGSTFSSATLSVLADPTGTLPVPSFRSFSVYGGELTGSFPNSVFYDNIIVEITAVPESSTIVLVGTSFVAFVASRIRRQYRARQVK